VAGARRLRARLAWFFAVSLALLLLLYTLLAWLTLRQVLSEQLDERLGTDVRTALFAARVAETEADGGDAERVEDIFPLRWAIIRTSDGEIVFSHHPREQGAVLPHSAFDSDAPVGSTRWQDHSPPEMPERNLRVLTRRVVAADGRIFDVTVARSLGPMERELKAFVRVYILLVPLGVLVAGFLAYLAAGRLLRPVGEMAALAGRIRAKRLSERLPVEGQYEELGRLAEAFNDTLARLEDSFARLRHFTADVSHELRTPLMVLRSVGEEGLRQARDAEDLREVVGEMLEEADKLASLVETLLLLARADSGEVRLAMSPLDVSALAGESAHFLDILAEERGQRIVFEGREGAIVMADPGVLSQELNNVLHNALRHSPPGSTVTVRIVTGAEEHAVEIEDQGPGIEAEHLPRIFDRFYRVRQDRSRTTGGSGLGLAIAAWAASSHGGRIEVESEPGVGSRFRIVLPALAAANAASLGETGL
jgi:heavy metal sensor kinase